MGRHLVEHDALDTALPAPTEAHQQNMRAVSGNRVDIDRGATPGIRFPTECFAVAVHISGAAQLSKGSSVAMSEGKGLLPPAVSEAVTVFFTAKVAVLST